jgi:radical SAM superfamily enzyme YgiQ (UPF0313 family)
MTASQRVLLINPTITSHRHARFPLAVMSLSAALQGKYKSTIIDGNVDRDFVSTALRAVDDESVAAVGVTVMGGPQLCSAIAVSKAIREKKPALPIIWGGAFPTVCPDAALNASYVDYAVRSQGEDTLIELLDALADCRDEALNSITGLSWRLRGQVVHNKDRRFSAASLNRMLPYDALSAIRQLSVAAFAAPFAGLQPCFAARWRCRRRRVWSRTFDS